MELDKHTNSATADAKAMTTVMNDINTTATEVVEEIITNVITNTEETELLQRMKVTLFKICCLAFILMLLAVYNTFINIIVSPNIK
jgi:hypothetical protein